MMRNRHILLLIIISLCGGTGLGQGARGAGASWTGYLIDLTCARERKSEEKDLGEKHTRKCMEMPSCDHSGFGLLTDGGGLLVFDEDGNRKVRTLLKHTEQPSHLRAVVLGARSNDVLKVRKVELQKQ
jgi:hypothetical protein